MRTFITSSTLFIYEVEKNTTNVITSSAATKKTKMEHTGDARSKRRRDLIKFRTHDAHALLCRRLT